MKKLKKFVLRDGVSILSSQELKGIIGRETTVSCGSYSSHDSCVKQTSCTVDGYTGHCAWVKTQSACKCAAGGAGYYA